MTWDSVFYYNATPGQDLLAGFASILRPDGGIGRRNGLKIRREVKFLCQFKSGSGHSIRCFSPHGKLAIYSKRLY